MSIKLIDIIKFIKDYQKDTMVCKDWTINEIANTIVKSIEDKAFVVDTDNIGNINGIVICEPVVAYNLLYVNVLLVKPNTKGVIKRMLKEFYNRYPNWDIQARRGEDETRYKNTARFCHLLEILT